MRLERMEAREKEHQKYVRKLYRERTNLMAQEMKEAICFYDRSGNGGHYDYYTFEEFT